MAHDWKLKGPCESAENVKHDGSMWAISESCERSTVTRHQNLWLRNGEQSPKILSQSFAESFAEFQTQAVSTSRQRGLGFRA